MQRSSNRPPPLSIDVVLGVGGGEPQTIHQRASSSGDDSPLRQPLLQGGNKSGRLSDRGCCWFHPPTTPLTWQYAFTIRGAECLHLYLWILKDLAWTQEWYYPSWVFGTLAVGWSLWLLGSSLYDRATNEVFIRTASLIWILGNWWWITGEVHDWKYPEDPPIYDERTAQTAYILDVGLCWLATFYLFIKPFKLFDADNPEMLIHYDTTGLPPRLLFFKTWREYENVHILFWMAKDVAWANNAPAVWIFFSIPTIFMAWDFVYCSLLRKHLMVDHAHYCAMFVWVAANAVWAGGELFNPDFDYPFALDSVDPEAAATPRWYSAWLLVATFFPIVVMYILWVHYTCSGAVKGSADPEVSDHHTPDDRCKACELDHSR